MELPPFYPILDTRSLDRCGCSIVEAAEAVIEAGARILQLRHKTPFDRATFADAQRIAAACRQAGVQLIVNDRADIALLLEAGLHVGQEDLPPAEARRLLGPERVIGFSTHNEEQLRSSQSEPVDYVAIGPIFPTGSKGQPDPVLETRELARLRQLTSRPAVAIGGITRESARQVLETGADSVAVISDLCLAGSCREDILKRTQEWLNATQ